VTIKAVAPMVVAGSMEVDIRSSFWLAECTIRPDQEFTQIHDRNGLVLVCGISIPLGEHRIP
jgi:hypothetical protein